MKKFIIGIDAGGTKTRACAYDAQTHTLLSQISTGSGNPSSSGPAAIDEITRAAEELCASIDGECVCAAVGAAGLSAQIAGTPARDLLKTTLRTLPCMKNAGIQVLTDAELALYANFEPSPDRTSAIVISGTGSAVFAFSGETVIRSGGWGNILGDSGSGYHVGLLLLKELTRMIDTADDSVPELHRTLCNSGCLSGTDLRSAIVDLVYRQPKSAAAALAPVVADLAKTWETARQILQNSASALADDAEHVFRRSAHSDRQLAYTGGFITGCKLFREIFINELNRRFPGIRIRPAVDPTLGVISLYQRS